MKILDVGCGAGGMSVLMARHALVVALDPEPQHLRATRDRARRAGTESRVISVLGDVQKLQFIASEFDAIWCSRVIHHHLPDVRPALSEMYRVLKPGGRLFLRENNNNDFMAVSRGGEGLWNRLGLAQQRWFQNKFRHRRPANEEWLSAMTVAGFRGNRCIAVPYVPSELSSQIVYIKGWLEAIVEDDASPEYGDLLDEADRLEIPQLIHGLTEAGELDIRVPTQICIGTK